MENEDKRDGTQQPVSSEGTPSVDPEGTSPVNPEGTPPSNGYPQQPGYMPPNGYPQQQGYMPPNGYPPQGYQQPGYPPQPGYGQQPGYPPQGYQQPGYPPQPGYGQQPGYPPQGYAPYGYAPPPGTKPPKVKKQRTDGKKSKAWLWILIAVLVLAAAAVAFVLFILPGMGGGSNIFEQPLVYSDDGTIYLAVGTESIELEGAVPVSGYEMSSINGMTDYDYKYLYYLADADAGEGTLMRIKLRDANAKPETCVKDVGNAMASADGTRVLYLKNIEDGAGDLYLWTGSDSTSISSSVAVNKYNFSGNGSNIYFTKTKTDSDGVSVNTIYMKNGNADAEEVAADSEDETIGGGAAFDDGTMLYMMLDSATGSESIYRYAAGESERVAKGSIIAAYSSSELLYSDEETLYYRSAAGDRERVSDTYYNIYPISPIGFNNDLRVAPDRRVLLVESEDQVTFTMSDYTIGQDPIKITECDNAYVTFSKNFDWVAYQNKGAQYLAHKTGSEWEDRIDVCDTASSGSFNESGSVYYYVSGEGDFGSYTLSSGENDELYNDASYFRLVGDKIYVVNTDNELYLLTADGKDDMMAEDVYSLTRTFGGGIFVIITGNAYDIEYFAPGSTDGDRVAYDVDGIAWLNGYVSYNSADAGLVEDYSDDTEEYTDDTMPTEEAITDPTVTEVAPMSGDLDTTLYQMFMDAMYYMGYDTTVTPALSLEENENLADALLLEDLTEDQYTLLYNFSYGFFYMKLYEEYSDANDLKSGQQFLDEAINLYNTMQ